jgi:hypothetical protein
MIIMIMIVVVVVVVVRPTDFACGVEHKHAFASFASAPGLHAHK